MQDFFKGGSNLCLQEKKGVPEGGPILGPMLKSLHRGSKRGGGGSGLSGCAPDYYNYARTKWAACLLSLNT